MTQKTKKWINGFVYCLRRYHLGFMTFILLASSLYFFLGASRFKSLMNAGAPDRFESGGTVQVVDVVDGDEVLIANSDGAKTVLRLLGIKSFDASAGDPMLCEYGTICCNYLKGMTLGREGRLEIADERVDSEGRLVGSLFMMDNRDRFTLDVAADLIDKGYALAYSRHRFGRMEEYQAVQHAARQERTGFWSNSQLASLADTMTNTWMEGARDD